MQRNDDKSEVRKETNMLKVVKTENGLVRGYPGGGSPGDIASREIPFAAPPTG